MRTGQAGAGVLGVTGDGFPVAWSLHSCQCGLWVTPFPWMTSSPGWSVSILRSPTDAAGTTLGAKGCSGKGHCPSLGKRETIWCQCSPTRQTLAAAASPEGRSVRGSPGQERAHGGR